MELLEFTDYAKAECERVRARLPQKKTGDLRFAFFSDLHYKAMGMMRTAVSNIVHTVNALNKTEKIDFVCLGGDNVGNYPGAPEDHIRMMTELHDLLSHLDVPFFLVHGNHDDNSIHGRIAPDAEISRAGFEIRHDGQYDILFSHAEKYENYHPAGRGKLYGYLDLPDADTRALFLNTSDSPYIVGEDGILKYTGQWNFAYSGDQLRFVCEEALRNAPKNLLVFQHGSAPNRFFPMEKVENYDAMNRLLKAFANGEKISLSREHEDFGFAVTADFGGNTHRIPAKITGHCHADLTFKDESDFLYITTMLAGRKNSGWKPNENGVFFEREPLSDKETSLDIFTFDPEAYTLSAVRYGSGEDRKFDI
ncbi:MAG: metallophosphoesterase [Clostridia bacterium]|nr:metallophosphoesterase [Clostridia bacterium]